MNKAALTALWCWSASFRPLLVSEILEICILQRMEKRGKRYKRQQKYRHTCVVVLCFIVFYRYCILFIN